MVIRNENASTKAETDETPYVYMAPGQADGVYRVVGRETFTSHSFNSNRTLN